ncbi:MAG TPA: hypothetical protein V6D08_17620 [Candidatus Obscuribacterales bacterium]
MTIMYRQGDVLLVKQDRLPEGARQVNSQEPRIVLAFGEATGHAHAIGCRSATLYRVGHERFLRTEQGATLTHEEHAPITLEPGVYRVVRQREYAPWETRYVYD